MLDDASFSKLVVDIHDGKATVNNEEGWFIALDMPWFWRSKEHMPTFREFARKYDKDLKMAVIDCWTEEGHKVCGKLDTRTYPAFYYFPAKAEFGD